jgi:hypothetical protein
MELTPEAGEGSLAESLSVTERLKHSSTATG